MRIIPAVSSGFPFLPGVFQGANVPVPGEPNIPVPGTVVIL